jgi:4-amino-4-deoxy-L-arabinose transferase-like glycosyltransferase
LLWAHQDYPLLLPGAVAQGFLMVGSEPRWLPAAVAFVFAALTVAVLASALGALRTPDTGLLGAIALLTTPCFVGFAANQQSDVPIGAFLLATSALLATGIETGKGRLFALAGVCASLAAWTKNEGALYAACLAAALVAVPWGAWRERRRALLRFASGALPVFLLLAWFKLRVSHVNDLLHTASGSSLLDLHKWGTLAAVLLRRLVYFQNWSLWLVAELVVLVAVLPRVPAQPAARVVGLALAGALAGTAVVYVLQPHELLWFVRASFDRILIQLWPSILLATFLALIPKAPSPRTP